MEHSTGDEGLIGTTSTSAEGNREDLETSEAPSAAPPQEIPTLPTSENKDQSEISETRNVQVIARGQALFDFPGEDEGDLPFKFGDIINIIEYCKFFSVSRLLFKVIVDLIFVLANS